MKILMFFLILALKCGKTFVCGNETQDLLLECKERVEVSAKTTNQATSNGPIAITEVNPEGEFIKIENTLPEQNDTDIDINGWKITQTVDGKRSYIYTFGNVTLKPEENIKIFASGAAFKATENDLVFTDKETWGIGAHVYTSLQNEKGEETATHKQKTLYN